MAGLSIGMDGIWIGDGSVAAGGLASCSDEFSQRRKGFSSRPKVPVSLSGALRIDKVMQSS